MLTPDPSKGCGAQCHGSKPLGPHTPGKFLSVVWHSKLWLFDIGGGLSTEILWFIRIKKGYPADLMCRFHKMCSIQHACTSSNNVTTDTQCPASCMGTEVTPSSTVSADFISISICDRLWPEVTPSHFSTTTTRSRECTFILILYSSLLTESGLQCNKKCSNLLCLSNLNTCLEFRCLELRDLHWNRDYTNPTHPHRFYSRPHSSLQNLFCPHWSCEVVCFCLLMKISKLKHSWCSNLCCHRGHNQRVFWVLKCSRNKI